MVVVTYVHIEYSGAFFPFVVEKRLITDDACGSDAASKGDALVKKKKKKALDYLGLDIATIPVINPSKVLNNLVKCTSQLVKVGHVGPAMHLVSNDSKRKDSPSPYL